MGPPRFSGGKIACSTKGENLTFSRFNGAAAFQRRKAGLSLRKPSELTRFKGAAAFQRRKVCPKRQHRRTA